MLLIELIWGCSSFLPCIRGKPHPLSSVRSSTGHHLPIDLQTLPSTPKITPDFLSFEILCWPDCQSEMFFLTWWARISIENWEDWGSKIWSYWKSGSVSLPLPSPERSFTPTIVWPTPVFPPRLTPAVLRVTLWSRSWTHHYWPNQERRIFWSLESWKTQVLTSFVRSD